jgi:hypothetical protein
VLPLRTQAYLADHGVPRPLAVAGGRILDTVFAMWSRMVLRTPLDGLVDQVRRFDGAFDEVTRRCQPWEGYWSPHDADFLNWRYCSDPAREHVSFALTVGSTLSGYSVVRVHQGQARLTTPRAAEGIVISA